MEKINYLNLRLFEKRLKKHCWTIKGYLTSENIIIIAEKNFYGYLVKKKFDRIDVVDYELDEYIKD